jgi:hypothetical protein
MFKGVGSNGEELQFPRGLSLDPWGILKVVVERVVAPRGIILNYLKTCAYIRGSKLTPVSLKFENPKG